MTTFWMKKRLIFQGWWKKMEEIKDYQSAEAQRKKQKKERIYDTKQNVNIKSFPTNKYWLLYCIILDSFWTYSMPYYALFSRGLHILDWLLVQITPVIATLWEDYPSMRYFDVPWLVMISQWAMMLLGMPPPIVVSQLVMTF